MNLRLYIDYDNLNPDQKRQGLLDLVTRALLATAVPTEKTSGRCEVRVYGGWYEATTLTPLAQNIIVEIGRDFPRVLPFRSTRGVSGKLAVAAELARSLEAEPAHHLFNTLRQKSAPRTLKCVHPGAKGCTDPQWRFRRRVNHARPRVDYLRSCGLPSTFGATGGHIPGRRCADAVSNTAATPRRSGRPVRQSASSLSQKYSCKRGCDSHQTRRWRECVHERLYSRIGPQGNPCRSGTPRIGATTPLEACASNGHT